MMFSRCAFAFARHRTRMCHDAVVRGRCYLFCGNSAVGVDFVVSFTGDFWASLAKPEQPKAKPRMRTPTVVTQ